MKFLERFLDLLHEKNLSISDVAKQTNLPRSTISSYINRKSIPSAVQLEVLANFFNVSSDYLIGMEDDFGNISATPKDFNGETLSEEEKDLIKFYRGIGDVERRGVLRMVQSFYQQAQEDKKKKSI